MIEENTSLDTIGNAYFLRTIHTDVVGVRRLLLITNKWHMARTLAVFEAVFALPGPPLPPGAACGASPEYVRDPHLSFLFFCTPRISLAPLSNLHAT